jgi:hypothetical protein
LESGLVENKTKKIEKPVSHKEKSDKKEKRVKIVDTNDKKEEKIKIETIIQQPVNKIEADNINNSQDDEIKTVIEDDENFNISFIQRVSSPEDNIIVAESTKSKKIIPNAPPPSDFNQQNEGELALQKEIEMNVSEKKIYKKNTLILFLYSSF